MLKRFIDILITILCLLLLSIPWLVVAWQVRRKLGSPVFFTQVRPGLHGKPFRMVKFRTMTDARDASGALLTDAQRLTPFGRFLRASRLDELPELWNVLCGEMSLVGPRPLLMEYLLLYSPEQARHHEVRPGITGWAQVNGRNAISVHFPGCRETVVDGDNGFLVPVQSVDALAEAMARFTTDPTLAARMGQRGRQLAEDKYDVHKVNAVMLKEMGLG